MPGPSSVVPNDRRVPSAATPQPTGSPPLSDALGGVGEDGPVEGAALAVTLGAAAVDVAGADPPGVVEHAPTIARHAARAVVTKNSVRVVMA
jgi:hypothetical protein